MSDLFPKYNKNRAIGDQGVSFVRRIIEEDYKWIFRPTHQEEDFGIDCFFDIINKDNSVTGKFIGAQIKTGESFFKTETSTGWVFRGENKHLNYYLNLNYPIIIVLVDLQKKTAFWCEFDINKTSKIKNGWSIIVPNYQKLDLESKSNLLEMPGIEIDYMAQIEYQWQLNNKIKNGSQILLEVSREEIINKDISGFLTLRDRFLIDDEMIKKTRGKLILLFAGYDDDKRELYQISEIRDWVKLVIPAFKYWGYFLYMDDENIINSSGIRTLQLCSVDYKITKISPTNGLLTIEPDLDQTFILLDKLFIWLNELCDKFSIDELINKEQSRKIIKVLYGEDVE